MLFYLCYRAGILCCRLLPRPVCEWIACRLADFSAARPSSDRRAIRSNLAAIRGTQQVPAEEVRDVFRNFALYLDDFLRFDRLTPERARRMVKVEGLERMEESLRAGRGAIGLTAHLGNYELAAAVISLLGMPVHGVVLTHRNRRVDDFFTRQRMRVGVRGIPVQTLGPRGFFEQAVSVLRKGEILGLVGDRDFFDHGIDLPFFGRTMRVPTGPAGFSLRTGAPIVPCFLVREPDGSYRMVFEPPLKMPEEGTREEKIRRLCEAWMEVLARWVGRYPTQWYVFQEFWRTPPAFIR